MGGRYIEIDSSHTDFAIRLVAPAAVRRRNEGAKFPIFITTLLRIFFVCPLSMVRQLRFAQ